MLTPNLHTKIEMDAPGVAILFIERDFNAQQKNSIASHAHILVIIQACYQRSQNKQVPFKARKPKAHQLQACALYGQDSALCSQSEDSSSEDFSAFNLRYSSTKQV